MFCWLVPNPLGHGIQTSRDCLRERACRLGSISINLLLQVEPERQVVSIVTSNL
jgi:hypothetical protein